MTHEYVNTGIGNWKGDVKRRGLVLASDTQTVMSRSLPRAVVLNSARLDYSSMALNWDKIAAATSSLTKFSSTVEADIKARSAEAEVLIVKEMPVPGSIINELDNSVKLIIEAGTGFNNIDGVAARARGISVCNVADYSSESVATLVLNQILNFSTGMHLCKADHVSFSKPPTYPLFELRGKTLGLIGGNGTIGKKVRDLATPFGMDVIVSSRSSGCSMEELLKRSDFVSLHCPLNDATRGMIGKDQIKMMKPTAYLVNTSRGAVINQLELVEALNEDLIAGAALDVFVEEPPQEGDPIWSAKNVVLTPHIGWQRQETRQRLLNLVAENIVAFFDNSKDNINVVNN